MKPAQPPRGSEKFGLASKVIVYGPRNSHAKFQRFLIKVTIRAIFDAFRWRYIEWTLVMTNYVQHRNDI